MDFTDDCGVLNGDNSSCADDCGVPNGDNSTCIENFVDPSGIGAQLSASSTGWTGSSAWLDGGGTYVGPHVSTDGLTPDGDGYYVRNIGGQSTSKYAITKVGDSPISSADRGNIEFTCDWASNGTLGARLVAIVDGTWYGSDQFGMGSGDHGDMNATDVLAWAAASANADNGNWYVSLAGSPNSYDWRDGVQWSNTPVPGGGLPAGDITQFGIAWLHIGNNNYGAVDNFVVSGN
jgi:hypothetical protein